jgi:hypothetical protein
MAADALPAAVHMIDYAYSTQGVFYHGTISDLDGTPKSTWTISVKDHKSQFDQPIDQETFSFLWNGIASYRIFKVSLVQGKDTPLDFYHFQIIGTAFRKNGQAKGENYMISPSEPDPEYKQWIKKLNVPLVAPKKETFFEKMRNTFKFSS